MENKIKIAVAIAGLLIIVVWGINYVRDVNAPAEEINQLNEQLDKIQKQQN